MPKKPVRKRRYDTAELRGLVDSANVLVGTQKSCGKPTLEQIMSESHIVKVKQLAEDYSRRLDKDMSHSGLMTDRLAEDESLRYYSEILTTYKPLLRQKSFYRLLRVFVQILYDYYSSAGIYQNVLHREGTSELNLFDFFQKIRTADVKDILHSSRYTSRSYAYLVRIIASLLHRDPKNEK